MQNLNVMSSLLNGGLTFKQEYFKWTRQIVEQTNKIYITMNAKQIDILVACVPHWYTYSLWSVKLNEQTNQMHVYSKSLKERNALSGIDLLLCVAC